MNGFTLVVVAAVWLPLGDQSAVALFFVVAFMGVGTGSFVPLGGRSLMVTYLTYLFQPFRGLPMCRQTLATPSPRLQHGAKLMIVGSFLATCVGTLCSPEHIGTWLGCCYTVISFA